ncbi:DUF1993 domain-containing protein [Croceicoccus bisphenolivorans]|uniref:DUF1993 domain-containing protein n=1 Tax=Croceicoccus bisphenolivorans TaxID=1783232 RepID=UPI0008334412|nr:DUF1993 domain-containing protein [Croceicoccus bisphenolivorans]
MTLKDTLSPTYLQQLGSLSSWLRKAQAQFGEDKADALLSARLAPDMLPLSTQVRFACVQAVEGMYRLRGEDFPPLIEELLDEGRHAGEVPGTMSDALARIDQVTALVAELALPELKEADARPVAHALPMGIIFDLTLEQYVRDWAVPQFYFHVMIAYAILRAQGADLGKADFVAHMFGYVRPGTLPEGMGGA